MRALRPPDTPEHGETATRILDAAERMFAENGYGGTSIRGITAAAGANAAAVHYHFGSKEAVLDAVLARRTGAMNEERHRRLDACLAAGGRPDLRSVLEAFVLPALAPMADPEGLLFAQLSGVLSVDPSPEVRGAIYRVYDALARRFVAVLRAAVPDLPDEDLFWRLNALFGAMMYVRGRNGRVDRLVAVPQDDVESIGRHLVAFLAAGMLAPPVGRGGPDVGGRPTKRKRKDIEPR